MDVLAYLEEKGVLDAAAVASIRDEVDKEGTSIEEALRERGISEEDILAAHAEYFQAPARSLGDASAVSSEVLKYIPEESARHYKFVPIGLTDGVLEVGTTDPDNLEGIEALNFITSKTSVPYKLFLISETDFNRVLEMYRGLGGEVHKALNELQTVIEEDEGSSADSPEKSDGVQDVVEEIKTGGATVIKEDAPVTKIVATIIRYAVDGRTSDIHIEPTREELRVRFRVDGILHTSLRLPKKVERQVVARIKVLSSLKLDERRKPQDGRFSATIDERRIDFRVSTFPTYHGEKVVMRILDRSSARVTLHDLGLTSDNVDKIKKALKLPYGLVIISGPTGSGKSTTLYSMLQEVERDQRNVVSLEDPVEYDVDGVSQSQVKPEIGYTFASGLRSILRQDPDIIMVGEIRDKETAQLAIQAALTGHLVLSTLHTNNAVGVVPRLVDMGVDPYLIAPTLVLSIAQRLLRKRCDDAGKPLSVEGAIQAMIDEEVKDLPEEYRSKIPQAKEVYGIAASKSCPTGTRGRVAAFEILPTSHELERAILDNPVEENLLAIARSQGMFTMKEDAIIKMLDGVIPFEEVNTLGGDTISSTKE